MDIVTILLSFGVLAIGAVLAAWMIAVLVLLVRINGRLKRLTEERVGMEGEALRR